MKMLTVIALSMLMACNTSTSEQIASSASPVECIVLGTVQDAGAPHIGCQKACCTALRDKNERKQVISLALVDHLSEKVFLIEASPDMPAQLKDLQDFLSFEHAELPDGILLTHAHIGHYTGLMYLGKEARSSSNVPVYALPRMDSFLRTSGPWSQLVAQKNIKLMPAYHEEPIYLSANIQVTPLLVPHRDEFSETVGFLIKGPKHSMAFIPDIDKWEKWEIDIKGLIGLVDYALIDGTFYSGTELGNRDMALVPHPSIQESMEGLNSLSAADREKVHFIHFNHTNPVLDQNTSEHKEVLDKGFNLISRGDRFNL